MRIVGALFILLQYKWKCAVHSYTVHRTVVFICWGNVQCCFSDVFSPISFQGPVGGRGGWRATKRAEGRNGRGIKFPRVHVALVRA